MTKQYFLIPKQVDVWYLSTLGHHRSIINLSYAQVDADKSGAIEFDEFVLMMAKRSNSNILNQLLTLSIWISPHGWIIDKINQIIKLHISAKIPSRSSDQQKIQKVFNVFDKNQDG